MDTWQVLESLTSFHKVPHLNHCPSILFCTEIYLKHTVSSFSNIFFKHQAHNLSFQTLKPCLWFGGILQKVRVLFESAPSYDSLQVFFFFNIYLAALDLSCIYICVCVCIYIYIFFFFFKLWHVGSSSLTRD